MDEPIDTGSIDFLSGGDVKFARHDKYKKYNAKRRKAGNIKRRMIAWDGEGIDLRGKGQPQSYVLFGCSARVDDPLVIQNPTDNSLEFQDLAEYMFETQRMFPDAWHVGFSFKYDQNMIFQSLAWPYKRALYEKGETRVRYGDLTYKIEWVPGKILKIYRYKRGVKGGDRFLIEDIFGFWASSFIDAYETTFPNAAEDEAWRTIKSGKQARGENKWEDFPEIRRYWEYEIVALEQLATGFRDLLWDNGFQLKQWYGPGAFANYLRRTHNLIPHEWGGKEENLPSKQLHHAIKCAYVGGHFEQYVAGRIVGPVYGYDINSAYPAAFCELPSMREGGEWRRIPAGELESEARNPSSPLTVIKISFRSPMKGKDLLLESRPMPLPFRDDRGNGSYGTGHVGWYWSPEVTAVLSVSRWAAYGWRVLDGWQWIPADATERPWDSLIRPMYAKRLELKAAKDPAQMAFKLGPNSLYGKMAQRVGADEDTATGIMKPPPAHTLCIAGFITSWCRGQMIRMMDAIDDGQFIGIETDGIYTTAPPEQIQERWPESRWGKDLGEWSGADEPFDEIIYVQNGVYTYRIGDKWKVKSRGIPAAALPPERIQAYVATCEAGEEWQPLVLDGGTSFVSLGPAIARSRNPDGTLQNSKAARLHCTWLPDEKKIDPAGAAKSKRIHQRAFCAACAEGVSLANGPHQLFIHQRLAGPSMESGEFRLPWENRKAEQWRVKLDRDDRSLRSASGMVAEGDPPKRLGFNWNVDASSISDLPFHELAKLCTVYGTKSPRELHIEYLSTQCAVDNVVLHGTSETGASRRRRREQATE